MASPKNSHPLLFTSLTSDLLCDEFPDQISLPMTTNMLTPNSASSIPTSIIPSINTINEINNENDPGQPLIRKRRSTKTISLEDVKYRLARRKILHNRLCIISDFMCILGLIGVILMIIENEITFMNVNHEEVNCSLLIKIIISITTIILVGLVFYYHYLDLSLYAINNSLNHWRVGLTKRKIILIVIEAFICAIHPIPRCFPSIQNLKNNNSTIFESISPSYITMDVAFGLPMFARIYLICRFILFHSPLVYNASSQSVGYLNQVSINFFFLIKTYLEQWPTRCLLTFCIFVLFIGSWSLRACNYSSTAQHISMIDSMWLFIVTFTTVGYGDLTPSTYCGRTVAAITGLIGVFSTALLISVLAQKLELTRSEKYVHNFVLKIELAKERKHQAANIVKFALKVWYLERKHQSTSNEYIKAQRRLFRAIHFRQKLKQEQKNLIDNCVGLPEIITLQRDTSAKLRENTKQLKITKLKVHEIGETLDDMKQTMVNIQNTLYLLLDRKS